MSKTYTWFSMVGGRVWQAAYINHPPSKPSQGGMKHTALGELINFCNGRVQMVIPLPGVEMLLLGELVLGRKSVLTPAESIDVRSLRKCDVPRNFRFQELACWIPLAI